jgi:glyoxylase-like metal-dependent hydrolase (beta-lactamase superfamily II)
LIVHTKFCYDPDQREIYKRRDSEKECPMLEVDRFEDVTRIRMSRAVDGKPLFWVAAYLVDGLLIDTGCLYTVEELVGYLEDNPPKLAVNTHYHEDHIAANRRLQEHFGINIYAHRLSVPLIGREATLFPYQEIVWGYPDPSTVLPIPPAVRTDRFTFEVMEVPGHSRDHIALIERAKGWCFTGDAVVGPSVKTLRPEEDIATTIVSLRKLAALETERLILFTSSGRIFEDGRATLANFERFIGDLSRPIRDLHGQGRSIPEIVTALFGGEDPRALRTDGQFSCENLIRSVLNMGKPDLSRPEKGG